MLPGVWAAAGDGPADGVGWGSARLWGLLPMARRIVPEVLIVQLIRKIAELVWLPEFALSSPELAWSDIGPDAIKIRSHADEREIVVNFEANDQADIVRAYSPSRPYEVPDGYEEAHASRKIARERNLRNRQILRFSVQPSTKNNPNQPPTFL